jgi:histidinol-phosphate aminotransferase
MMVNSKMRFDAAINPYGCSPRVEQAMLDYVRSKEYRHYGDANAESLRVRLAERFGLSPENILVYNGAGEALVWLFISNLLLQQGKLIVPFPSYERFVDAAKRCAEVVEVPLTDGDYSLPVEQIVEEGRTKSVTMGLLSNPNNPTGNLLLDTEILATLLDELPECLWVVDEAYADYAGVTYTPWVQERKNLVVLRTFPKAHGLAGLRIGYAVAHSDIIQKLSAFHIPWCVDSMALVAAQAAIEDEAYLDQIVCRIREDCAAFHSKLISVPGIEVHPSAANFFLVRLREHDPERLKQYLADRQIQVRSRPDMPEFIRVTSLTEEENNYFIGVLQDFVRTSGEMKSERSSRRQEEPSVEAVTSLATTLGKPTDGIVSKHFNRMVSGDRK